MRRCGSNVAPAALRTTPVSHRAWPGCQGGEGAPKISHCFQPGPFTAAERALCWVAKWRLYSAIGLVTGFVSMLATALLSRDAALLAAPVFIRAALTGCMHLGISANTRYQLVNGAEVLLYSWLPQGLARGSSVAIRMGNNFLGARLWMVMAALVSRVV